MLLGYVVFGAIDRYFTNTKVVSLPRCEDICGRFSAARLVHCFCFASALLPLCFFVSAFILRFASALLPLCFRFASAFLPLAARKKVDTISTRFRTFPMEVIAGEDDTEVRDGADGEEGGGGVERVGVGGFEGEV